MNKVENNNNDQKNDTKEEERQIVTGKWFPEKENKYKGFIRIESYDGRIGLINILCK